MIRILIKFNDAVLKVIETDKPTFTIGRNLKNDILIDNLAVSNVHARVDFEDGHYFIEDLGSTNGTYVNDRRITRWGLSDGDIITIGKHALVFLLDDETAGGGGQGVRELDLDRTMVLDTDKQRARLERAELSSAGPAARLLVKAGKGLPPEIVLSERVAEIGKGAGATVRLTGLFAPGNAAYITRDKSGYTLVPGDDAKSLRLNGRPLDEGVTLKEGDVIEVGKVRLRFTHD